MPPDSSDRRDFLRALLAGATGATAGQGIFAQAAATGPIQLTKITDRISMLSGDGGNVGLVTGDDGLMMIDGGFANRAAELQKAVAGVDSHPVRILFNTHWHSDHVGSNELLGRAGVKIIAQQNVKYWVSQKVNLEALATVVEPLKPEGWPVQTFTDGGKMTFGKEKFEYKWIPYAHTDNDSYVFFPNANVLQTGDLFFHGTFPVIDYTTGGWISGTASALDKLLKVGDAKTQIIAGHGSLATKEDLKAACDMAHTVEDRLNAFSKKGAHLDEVLKANPVSDLDAKWGQGFLHGDQFLRMAYLSIDKHAQLVKNVSHRRVSW